MQLTDSEACQLELLFDDIKEYAPNLKDTAIAIALLGYSLEYIQYPETPEECLANIGYIEFSLTIEEFNKLRDVINWLRERGYKQWQEWQRNEQYQLYGAPCQYFYL